MNDYTTRERQEAARRGIHLGNRGQEFTTFISGLLTKANLKGPYLNKLLSKYSLQEYAKSFTAKSANHRYNYEVYEQLGDLSINKTIVGYAYRRFPFLDGPWGVGPTARLRIIYGSGEFLGPKADELGFWPFISALELPRTEGDKKKKTKTRSTHKKELLEDCFEAFIGCTEQLLDNQYRIGVGYAIVYDILVSILDEVPMPLGYNDLFDAKTRLKEIFDKNEKIIGSFPKFKLLDRASLIEGRSLAVSRIFPKKGSWNYNRVPGLLAEGRGVDKVASAEDAARIGIKELAKIGFHQSPKPLYEDFQQGRHRYSKPLVSRDGLVETVAENKLNLVSE